MRRREAHIPILSMLDLLFGTFGAMIVVATMITFLRLDESRLPPRPMYFVAAKLDTIDGAPSPDLSKLFIEFQIEPGATLFSPLDGVPAPAPGSVQSGPGTEEPEYHASSSNTGPAASLLMPEAFMVRAGRTVGTLRLRARIRGLPSLVFGPDSVVVDQYRDQELRISVMIQTAHFGCAAEREVTFGTLLHAEAAPARGASIFELLGRTPAGIGVICSNPEGRAVIIGEPDLLKVDTDGFLQIPAQ